ncbi:helix-turn-helix domain-containing protein [Nocardia sp. CC201C]|uniref:helix-turn-helix domain-containing protein n=1 Tax=Nocardia sp. CC201C TaxID=3044575 RepID=UPI0024A94585|nr:helix-turn-helix domain-containing protein [Nocardia sp. CC201C]
MPQQPPTTDQIDTARLLRVLGAAAIRMADGAPVERSWLLRQLDPSPHEPYTPQQPALRPLLTIPEAAARLRISRWSIYDLIHKRLLLTVKIGRRRFVPGSELQRYLTSLPLTGGQLL